MVEDLKVYSEEQHRIALISKAMGHPARMFMLEFLAGRHSAMFSEIYDAMSISKSTVSQHLSELKRVDLIYCESEGSKARYSINWENWRLVKNYFADFFANIYRERGMF